MDATRRQLLKAVLAASSVLAALPVGAAPLDLDPLVASLPDLVRAQLDGRASAQGLLAWHLQRISELDPKLHALIELNPEATAAAAALDTRKARRDPGPLHGVPVLIKANIGTADPVSTCAGSLALEGVRTNRDSPVVSRLRAAGAIVVGTANLSEWANFRSTHSSSGWSARGGQCRNPHVLDRTPCGSSAGSAAAVAAGLVPLAIGTETDGSLVCPAALCGIVTLKPGLGRVPAAGIVPIAPSQDVPGPMGRSVRDVAIALQVMMGGDEDLVTGLRTDALRGARLGVYGLQTVGRHPGVDASFEEALRALQDAGAELVQVDGPAWPDALEEAELEVMVGEFAASVAAWLTEWAPGAAVRSLADVVDFNTAHADEELAWFGQEWMERAIAHPGPEAPAVVEARAVCRRLALEQGVHAMLGDPPMDAIVCPTVAGPAWPIDLVSGDHFPGGCSGWAAVAGTPHVTVPMGLVHHLPVGLSMFGAARSEARLLALAYAFEQATAARVAPSLRPSLL